eukprot:Hpha_TRINITY_DN5189_c0_g1::TRINITY_DN5189_c0_g1_i1::g.192986::m.192986
MAALKLNFSKVQTTVTVENDGKLFYRHHPYAPTPTAECAPTPTAEKPCLASQLSWTTPYEYSHYSSAHANPWPIPQQAYTMPYECPQSHLSMFCTTPSHVDTHQHVPGLEHHLQTPPSTRTQSPVAADGTLSLSVSREATQPVEESSIFEGCSSKRERRALAMLVITKGLQEGKNRTYGAARRKMTKWAHKEGISKEDLAVMVDCLNELYLAGAGYDTVALPAAQFAEGVSEKALSHVAHLVNTDDMWEGCLCFLTPAQCYARRA